LILFPLITRLGNANASSSPEFTCRRTHFVEREKNAPACSKLYIRASAQAPPDCFTLMSIKTLAQFNNHRVDRPHTNGRPGPLITTTTSSCAIPNPNTRGPTWRDPGTSCLTIISRTAGAGFTCSIITWPPSVA
jgi:hypothetical protein